MSLSHRGAEPAPAPPSGPAPSQILDLIGIGFGPSNLALAATIQEEAEAIHGRRLRSLFFERKPNFDWHPSMLLPEARIQLTFLKDLVTLRNPQSRFTFLRYLRDHDRLDEFANLRKLFPSRVEFNDYYRWAARQVEGQVRYRHEVEEIAPVEPEDDETVELVRVRVRDLSSGAVKDYLTRNLVLADGGGPVLPPGVDEVPEWRVLHFQNFLSRLRESFPRGGGPYSFVVIGSGQTAAEIFHHLLTHYPDSRSIAAFRSFAFKPADDSHFVNEIFFPEMIDFLYDLPEDKRARLLDSHRDTNYAAVDLDLIEKIYEDLYERKVTGRGGVSTRQFLDLCSVEEGDHGLLLHFRNLVHERDETMEADAVALATGVQRDARHPLLESFRSWLLPDGDDGYQVDRTYRVKASGRFRPRIYLQGFCERTHGLSDTLLSILPYRSMEILETLQVVPFGEAEATGDVELRQETLQTREAVGTS